MIKEKKIETFKIDLLSDAPLNQWMNHWSEKEDNKLKEALIRVLNKEIILKVSVLYYFELNVIIDTNPLFHELNQLGFLNVWGSHIYVGRLYDDEYYSFLKKYLR